MQQQVKQYVDSMLATVISDEVTLSQLSQQCEPPALPAASTSGPHYYYIPASFCVIDFSRCNTTVETCLAL